MRVCLKCGDYYADDSLAFCLADGAPLVVLDAGSEMWSEGRRVIQEKENALRKQQRRLKWRRVSVRVMLVATMVVCVVAVNSYIYLKPTPDAGVLAEASPTAEEPSGVVDSIRPTPDDPPPTPTPVCVEADESSERADIIKKFGKTWRLKIEGEQTQIIAEHTPDGVGKVDGVANVNRHVRVVNVEVTLVDDKIEYASRFPKACRASLTASYAWLVRTVSATPRGDDVKDLRVEKVKHFDCKKAGAKWSCH